MDESSPGSRDHRAALDAIGRRNEALRVRIVDLTDRLEDLTTLKREFDEFVDPLAGLITEFPEVQSRLRDAEAMLQQARDANAALSNEILGIRAEASKAADEIATLRADNQGLNVRAGEAEDQVQRLRVALTEKELQASDLERRVFVETERADALSNENQALRRETQAGDQAVARLERSLAEAREQIEMLEHDNKTLQAAASEQAERFGSLEEAYRGLLEQLQAARQTAAHVEEKLTAEQSARAKLEAQIEAERASHRLESGRLEMRVEGVLSRMNVTERILAHTRDQLRERTEELKVAERGVKEAIIARNTAERRVEGLQEEVVRLTTRSADAERAHLEAAQRCDMLTKSIASKDATISKADHRIVMLLDRIDQLTAKFNAERGALEADNTKLMEELQGERSARALAEGALEASRQSRVDVQRDLLKGRRKRIEAGEVEILRDDPGPVRSSAVGESFGSHLRAVKNADPK
jgi:crescentin